MSYLFFRLSFTNDSFIKIKAHVTYCDFLFVYCKSGVIRNMFIQFIDIFL